MKELVLKYSLRYKLVKTLKGVGVNFDPSKSPELQDMITTMANLPGGGVQFSITQMPDGEWVAESTNIDGILTGGDSSDNINDMIADAIFTYFGVPPAYCDSTALRQAGEPLNRKQEIFATAPVAA